MPMDASEIERLIKAAMPDAEVTIQDLAGDNNHYAARIVSALLTLMSSQASGVWNAECGVMISRPSTQGSRAR